jgi:tRNA(fMet)-specific endonuclease VapC
MSYFILDTDHFSLWQRNHPRVVSLVKENANNIIITIITVEELLRGRFNVIRQASTTSQADKLVLAYNLFWETLEDLKLLNTLKFEQKSYDIYTELRLQKIRIGTQDLKIASITLANNSVLVTRNYRDFSQIPNLRIEDWTISK